MASAFGDQSYSKLPPITKCSTESDEHNSPSHLQSFNREAHGLVRLPPIQLESPNLPLDLLEGIEDQDMGYNIDEESPLLSQFKKNTSVFSSRSSEIARQIGTGSDSSEDESPSVNWSTTLLSSSLDRRREKRKNVLIAEPKLHRSRRLGKSSPDLSSRRKFRSPARETKSVIKQHDSVNRASSPLSLMRLTGKKERETLDIDINVFPPDQAATSRTKGSRDMKGKDKENKSKSRYASDEAHKSISHPNTPVIPLFDRSTQGISRKSVGDIGDGLVSSHVRRSSLAPPRKQNLVVDERGMDSLRVDGKTCLRNRRLIPRSATLRSSETLQVPDAAASKGKRSSIYDLQQILAVLNKEASSKPNSQRAGPVTLEEKERTGSVYDLKEFLLTQLSEESVKRQVNTHGPENLSVTDLDESGEHRRGSFYDLMGFLSLNSANNQENTQTNTEKSAVRYPPSPLLLNPNSGSASQEDESRRSSVYDLMEFLALVRAKSEGAQSENKNAPQTVRPQISLEAPPEEKNVANQRSPGASKNRSGSVYNLTEFLNITSSTPRRKDHHPKTTPSRTGLLSPRSPNLLPNLQFKRESIYDLQEFLGILQKEDEIIQSTGTQAVANGRTGAQNSASDSQRSDDTSIGPSNDQSKPLFTFDTLGTERHSQNRAMSLYDLREYLALYAAQPQTPHRLPFTRKASSISQSSILINVTEDENGNGNVEELFLALPMEGGPEQKRGSVYDLKEFLGILNTSDSPLRRRLSSVSSSVSPGSETSIPPPVGRHDSGGAKSLYDLNEFLTLLDEDAPPTPTLARHDSGGANSVYNLEEFLPILNDTAALKNDRNEEPESSEGDVIRIQVPQLPPRKGSRAQANPERLTLHKRLSESKSALNSVPEASEVTDKR